MNTRLFFSPLFACLLLAGPAMAQSTRSGFGATPYADASGTGVTFRTWAPNASSVAVKGSFNGWGSTPLVKEATGGIWSADIPRAKAGDEYKFFLNGSLHKRDPRGRRVVNSAGNSIVYNPKAFDWGSSTNFAPIWRNDLVIYEMHAGSFNAEDWLPSTFDECAEKIPYLKALGISAVELMPVNEFPGDRSWGYNPSDLFAIESSHGGPDSLKRFVKACHENGLAVLVDVVHNHYGPSDLDIWQFDGWSQNGLGGIYFYNTAAKADTDWGDTRPDYGRQEVKDFILGQIQMFVEDYHIDGFRWDSVYNIRHYGDTWNPEGSDMLAQVNGWLQTNHPDVFRIAEDHAFDTDVGFEAQWDHGYLNDIRWLAAAGSDSDRNMDALAYHLGNGGFGRVVYVESHDTCGDLNNKHRLPYDIDSSGTNYWSKKRALLGNGIVLVSPGIPMIFEGSEMNEWWTFSNNQELRWSLTNSYAGIVRAYADLIHLRRNAYGNTSGFKQPDKVNVHHVDITNKVVGVIRWDVGGKTDDVVVAINCSFAARTNYAMAFPSPGTWYCLYNSDLKTYDAEFGNVGPAVGDWITAGTNANLDLGAYSIQIYSKTPTPADSAATFDPPVPDGCGSTVTITYAPGDGPLTNAAAIHVYLGRNNWQAPTNFPMIASGQVWTAEYVIPDDTFELNLSFTDESTNLWDNNEGANWRVPVANCGDLPAAVALTPPAPQGCVPVTFSYEVNGGPLTNSAQIGLHIGQNGWKNVQDVPLANATGDVWTAWFAIPDDTWQLDYVFFNESNVWDNNNGKDWHAIVADCVRADEPQVAITNPAPAVTVSNSILAVPLAGTARLLAGQLTWTNVLAGNGGTVPYATNWSIADVPLAPGVNVIHVSGTNSAVNANAGAGDSPTNAAYASGWLNGANGGTGFQAWILRTNGSASYALAVSNAESGYLSLGPQAWALTATNGGFIEAIRPFAAPLVPGDQVFFVFENGGIDGGAGNSSVGVAFQNRFDQRLTEILFNGGDTNFVVNGLAWRNTGIPWSNTPKICTLEMLTELTYRFTVNGQAFEGELAEKSELLISRIRFWNYNAGGTQPVAERKFYVGDLSITGAPRPVLTYAAEVAVTRLASMSAVRQTESFVATDAGWVATVDDPAGIAGNVWSANRLLDNIWNWILLPPSNYVVSNHVVTILPDPTNRFQVFSIGEPGHKP